MAEVLQKEHKQKAGVRKTKKASLRVDLTPMVDLGFLLISFFVFTTTLSQPKAMKLAIPDDKNIKDSSKAEAGKTLNLILTSNNDAYAYDGLELNRIKNIGSNTTAIRDAIIQKKNELKNTYGSDSGMIVLIKPTSFSTYANIVDALDAMLICDIKTYMLMDATDAELTAIKQ